MLVEEVDAIGSQAFETRVRGRLDVVRAPVGAATALAGCKIDVETEFRGVHDALSRIGSSA